MIISAPIQTIKSLFSPFDAIGCNAVRYDISPAGISGGALDPALIMMCKVDAPASVFDVYDIEPMTIYLNIVDSLKIVRGLEQSVGKDHIITLDIGKSSVKFLSELAKAELPLLAEEAKMPNAPGISLPYYVSIDKKGFLSSFKTIESVWEESNTLMCELKIVDSRLVLRAFSDNESKTKNIEVIVAPCSGEARTLLRGIFLKEVINAMPNANVKISFGTDMPISIETTDNPVSIRTWLAPRTEAD